MHGVSICGQNSGTKTNIEKERIFADSLNWFDKKCGQLALDVDQMVQRLFGGICRNYGKGRRRLRIKLSGRHIRRAMSIQTK